MAVVHPSCCCGALCVPGVKCGCDAGSAADICLPLSVVEAAGGTLVTKIDGVCYTFDAADAEDCDGCASIVEPGNLYASCAACCADEEPACCETACGFGLDSPRCYNYPDGGGTIYAIYSYSVEGVYQRCCTASGSAVLVECAPVSISDSGLLTWTGYSSGCSDLPTAYTTPVEAVWAEGFVCCGNLDEDSSLVRLGAFAQSCISTGPNAGGRQVSVGLGVQSGLGVGFTLTASSGVGECQLATSSGVLSLPNGTCNGRSYVRIMGTWEASVQILNRAACTEGGSMLASGTAPAPELRPEIAAQLPPDLHDSARAILARFASSRKKPRKRSGNPADCCGEDNAGEGVIV